MKKDLAQALGISGSMVSRLAKQGMPTSSVPAAHAWRQLHLETARMKGFRAGTPYMPLPSKHVTAAEDAMRAGRAVLDAGPSFDVIAPSVQAAMQAVPERERHLVGMDEKVMRVLLKPLLDLEDEEGDLTASGSAHGGISMSDEDAAYVGRWLYLIACGEAWINPSTNHKPHTKGRANASAVNT